MGLLLLSGLPLVAFAQDAPAAATTTAAATETKPVEVKPPAKVSAARPLKEKEKPEDKRKIRLGDAVIVTVEHDETFRDTIKKEKEADANKTGEAKTEADARRVTLFLNGQDTRLEPIDSATNEYMFRLERNDKNKDLWARLLEAPFLEPELPLYLSVGYGGKPLPSNNDAAKLQLVKMDLTSVPALAWIAVLIVVLLYFFRYLVPNTDILRNGPPVGGIKQAYSLGRVQMAWWLFIVIVSYVTIWMISGNRDTVSQSTLVLLGISSATALGAVAIDSTASNRTKTALDRLNAEIDTLQLQAAAPGITPALATAITNRIAAIRQQQVNIITTPPSVNWLTDILTDDSGAVAVHRFQNVLWTFVLGVVFIASVAHVLSMPDFNSTLLTLMGISGVTYLGFKFPTSG